MELKSGDRVQVESESTERPLRTGVIEEVLRGAHSPRYRTAGTTGTRASTPRRRGRCIFAEPTEKA